MTFINCWTGPGNTIPIHVHVHVCFGLNPPKVVFVNCDGFGDAKVLLIVWLASLVSTMQVYNIDQVSLHCWN